MKIINLGRDTQQVVDLSFSPDGQRRASAGSDHTIRIRDTENWRQVDVLMGHEKQVFLAKFSLDGELLLS